MTDADAVADAVVETIILSTYYATESQSNERVLVVLWDDAAGNESPAFPNTQDGLKVVAFGVRQQALLNAPLAVSMTDIDSDMDSAPDIPYTEIFLSPERDALLKSHSNVQASTMCYQGAARGWCLVIGVVAKGYIPEGETEFPTTLTVTVHEVPYRVKVDVRWAWCP